MYTIAIIRVYGAVHDIDVGIEICDGGGFGSFFFQAEDGIRDYKVTGVQTCALPIYFAIQFFGSHVLDRSIAMEQAFNVCYRQVRKLGDVYDSDALSVKHWRTAGINADRKSVV